MSSFISNLNRKFSKEEISFFNKTKKKYSLHNTFIFTKRINIKLINDIYSS